MKNPYNAGNQEKAKDMPPHEWWLAPPSCLHGSSVVLVLLVGVEVVSSFANIMIPLAQSGMIQDSALLVFYTSQYLKKYEFHSFLL